MASQDPNTENNGASSDWKTEGHPWVDKGLQVAGGWAVPASRNTATTANLNGRIVAFGQKNENQRKPALGRVIYDAPAQPPSLRSMPENVAMAMDLTGTDIQELQKQGAANDAASAAMEEGNTTTQPLRMASSFPIANSTLIRTVQERYHTRLEQYLQESILPPLIALAALEEATVKMVKQRIAQEDAEAAARARTNHDSGCKLSSPHPPLYYSKPPNQYLTPPSSAGTSSSETQQGNHEFHSDPTKEHLSSTPSAWLSRIKLGCQQAWNEQVAHSQQEQQLLQLYSQIDTTEVELSTGRRSSSRIARIATEQWEQHSRKTRSAKQGAAAGVELYLKGHRIGSFLHKLWESEQKQRIQTTNDEGEEEEEEEHEEEEDEEDLDLFNPHLQPAYSDVLKILRKLRLEDIQNSLPHWCQETHSRTNQKVLRQVLNEEEEMENVLEVDVLPLDSLTLGIEERATEEDQEEEAEHIDEEEEVAAADKMEVEATTSAADASPTKDKAPEETAKTTVPVSTNIDASKGTESEKPAETVSSAEKAPESVPQSEAKAEDAAASGEAKLTTKPKEEVAEEEEIKEESTTKPEATSLSSDGKPKEDLAEDKGAKEESSTKQETTTASSSDGKPKTGEGKGETEEKTDTSAAPEASSGDKPSMEDGKSKPDGATSADSVPDVEMKTEPSAPPEASSGEDGKSKPDGAASADSVPDVEMKTEPSATPEASSGEDGKFKPDGAASTSSVPDVEMKTEPSAPPEASSKAKPNADDGTVKPDGAATTSSVPDVETKTEPSSTETNGLTKEEVKSSAETFDDQNGDKVKTDSPDAAVKTEPSATEMKAVKGEVKSATETSEKSNDDKFDQAEGSQREEQLTSKSDDESKEIEDEEGEEEDIEAPTESLILRWEIPDSVEKAPSKAQVHKYLQSQDNYSFGRCSFSLRHKDEEIEQLRRELEGQAPDEGELLRLEEEKARHKEAERAYQNKKNWDKWRFEGIHGGHTVWPKWQDAIKKWQSERNAREAGEKSDAGHSSIAADQVEADRAKALELAEKENEAEEAAVSGTAASRRTRRKGTSSAGTVFYGQSSQLTARQLVELILRLCSEKSTAPTILHLQSIVAEDGTQDPIRRLRAALGKLVWRRNQLARLTPSTNWTDKYLFETVRARPLLQVAEEPAPETDVPTDGAPITEAAGNRNDVEMMDVSATTHDTKQPTSEHKEEEEALLQYLQYLHQTELQLRKVVLDHITEIPIPIVATAADEKKGSNEGYDSADFEDQAEVDWQTQGHELIGKHIFRPRQMSNTNDLSQCEWFTIKAYVPSVPCEGAPDEPPNVAGSNVKDSPLVDRRMRFRAAPFLEEGAEEVEFDDEEYLVLTEAQAKAGIQAAGLEQLNIDREEEEEKVSIIEHPFEGSGISAKISLYPITKSKKKGAADSIQCTVVGHDSVLGDAAVETVHRILVLPSISDDNPSPTAMWATLDISDDTEMRCKLPDDPQKYRVQQSDFHPESQAFAECHKIVEFLENHQKATPFLEPVDPVALNIPDYTKIIEHPMDISTLSKKLEHGTYSNVPPKTTAGRSPVARMLNGPFRDDVELIFDNAMLFNPSTDWIYQDASTLKKAVLRKIDSISSSSDLKFRRSGRNQEKQSIYFDEDSDVDTYQYESDEDDDDDFGGSRRKRKRGKGPVRPKADDNSTRAMEQAIRLQKTVSETLGLRGPFANFHVENDASNFVHPPNWSCRRIKPGANKSVEPSEQDEESDTKSEVKNKYEEEMEQLVELQRTIDETEHTGLRRSTRTHDEGGSRQRGKKHGKKSDFEYYMLNALELKHVRSSKELSRMPPPSTRQDVEFLCERLHDSFYANLHQQLSVSLEQAKLVGEEDKEGGEEKNADELPIGSFANGSFPPFLGRMVPISLVKHGKFSWEIRAPFQIPALRWVIRGLIQSGHVGELEPLEQESMSSGVIMANHVYYTDSNLNPFEVLDTKELARRRRANNEAAESSEDEVELSAYEQARLERVARNKERLKALGLG